MSIDTHPAWEIAVLESVEPARALFAQLPAGNPFLTYAFWQALEQSQVIGAHTGWAIHHVLLQHQQQPVAWMPLFLKNHHRGEYVFDHAWADAYARHGLSYYPRLVSSIPFTPVSSAKVLVHPDYTPSQVVPYLFSAVQQIAQTTKASSWHILFVEPELVQLLQHAAGDQVVMRQGCQFLWTNDAYQHFDDFLAKLTAKKRKSIKVERAKVAKQGIECELLEGAKISDAQWQFFYRCYANTYFERGQKPYLNVQFFMQLGRDMPDNLLLIVAHQNGESVAAALFFKDNSTLYGRYWGAIRAIDCLHFEVCYYQGVEYAIKHQLQSFDPGTQGEHKLIRGFAPTYSYSAHWLAQPAFRAAVKHFCAQETQQVSEYYQAALNSTPFKQTP